MGNTRYRLKIRGFGIIKYYCEHGLFLNIRDLEARPYLFDSKIAAQNAYVQWARMYPTTARDWIPEIEEV